MWLKTRQNQFLSALYLREKVSSGRVFHHFWEIGDRFLRNRFQKCGSKSAKTSFWVLCTIVKKSALEGFFHHFWNMDDRFLRYWLQKCVSKPAKKIFSMMCKLVKKSVLEGFSQHFCETRMTRSFKILFRVVGQDSQNAFSDAIYLRETIRFWPFFKHISETIIY